VVTAKEAAKIIFNGLKETGINLIVTLPDINLAELLHEVEEDRTSFTFRSAARRKA
jgi:sulfopyruvate decarboxylase TPP-binding subunit